MLSTNLWILKVDGGPHFPNEIADGSLSHSGAYRPTMFYPRRSLIKLSTEAARSGEDRHCQDDLKASAPGLRHGEDDINCEKFMVFQF